MKVRSQWDTKKDISYEINSGELITDRSQAQKTSDIIQRIITGRSTDVHIYSDEFDQYRNVERFDLIDRMDSIDSDAEIIREEFLRSQQKPVENASGVNVDENTENPVSE